MAEPKQTFKEMMERLEASLDEGTRKLLFEKALWRELLHVTESNAATIITSVLPVRQFRWELFRAAANALHTEFIPETYSPFKNTQSLTNSPKIDADALLEALTVTTHHEIIDLLWRIGKVSQSGSSASGTNIVVSLNLRETSSASGASQTSSHTSDTLVATRAISRYNLRSSARDRDRFASLVPQLDSEQSLRNPSSKRAIERRMRKVAARARLCSLNASKLSSLPFAKTRFAILNTLGQIKETYIAKLSNNSNYIVYNNPHEASTTGTQVIKQRKITITLNRAIPQVNHQFQDSVSAAKPSFNRGEKTQAPYRIKALTRKFRALTTEDDNDEAQPLGDFGLPDSTIKAEKTMPAKRGPDNGEDNAKEPNDGLTGYCIRGGRNRKKARVDKETAGLGGENAEHRGHDNYYRCFSRQDNIPF
ncbi:hypothetical protein F5Y19DRAFT_342351 [Xylariaceae sp. FL1651]|nr:hypothetical protein F5Y19DRAFT_342351 [Xylariaceae sp. FL1651]